jgi:uncharacterized surface protein with fasciclin (FAS1) repeats
MSATTMVVSFMAAMLISASAQATGHQATGKNIIELLSSLPTTAGLVRCINAAGLADTLSGPGPFTIFAPSDSAFIDISTGGGTFGLYPAGHAQLAMDMFSEHSDRDVLAELLTYHVAPGEQLSTDLLPGTRVETLEGNSLEVEIPGGHTVVVIGAHSQASVTQADIVASNGVVHIIDAVLLPFTSAREAQEQMRQRQHDQQSGGQGGSALTQPSCFEDYDCLGGGHCNRSEDPESPGHCGDEDILATWEQPTTGRQCADLSRRVAAVNRECCDQAVEDCSSGRPSVCNQGCARVLLPFFVDCADALGPQASLYMGIVGTCTTACMGNCLDDAALNAVHQTQTQLAGNTGSHAGNPKCWGGEFVFGRCCDTTQYGANGDRSCWSGKYNFSFCCSAPGH